MKLGVLIRSIFAMSRGVHGVSLIQGTWSLLNVAQQSTNYYCRLVSHHGVGGRIRKPAASWHPSKLYPPIRTLEMSPSARPEIHQLHEAVKIARAAVKDTTQVRRDDFQLSSHIPTFLSFHPCFWPFIHRVDHVLALSP